MKPNNEKNSKQYQFYHISGPPFAFVEFEDPRDASDAVKARNNYDYDG